MNKRHGHSSPWFFLVLAVLVLGLAALLLFGGGLKLSEDVRGDADKRILMNGGLEWEGQLYSPRSDVTNILLFGVSHEDPGEEAPSYGKERHVSFAQLMLIDHGAKTVHRIPVDCDLVTEIRVPDGLGKTVLQTGPVVYSFSAGDGRQESCQYTVEAVEKLLPVGRIDFYVAVEADNLKDLLRIAAGIAKAAVPESANEGNSSRLMNRKARAELQSQQMAQLLTLITKVSSADEQEINRLLDAMAPYVLTDMPRGRMINEVWQIKPYLQLEKMVLPKDPIQARKMCMELFYQPVQE